MNAQILVPALKKAFLAAACAALLAPSLTACGKKPAASGTSGDNVFVQSAPLAGPSAGALFSVGDAVARMAVSSFTAFRACNDTLVFLDASGNKIKINGAESAEVGRGLLNFSASGTAPSQIGGLSLPVGTTISEVDITFAVVPSVCSGANYAVEFDPGTGPIDVTQNTAFKFKYATPITIDGSAQTVTLMFGTIVNAMAALGTSLNDSTIQSINVGQAK